MKFVIDMNLSPHWCATLGRHGHQCVHWSTVGDPRADDRVILAWALANGHVLVTSDLDFGAILASTKSVAPSVLQIRAQDVTPRAMEVQVVRTIRDHAHQLETGALIAIDASRARVRVLPLRP
jgi:predicted nuclease of predicted toxin-antitoxin system